MKQSLSILLLTLCALLPNAASAQDKTPVPNMEIQLLNSEGRVVQRQTTAQDGSFNFDKLPAGQYTINVEPKVIEQTALLMPALMKAKEKANRSRSGVSVAAGDVNGDGAAPIAFTMNFARIKWGSSNPSDGYSSREAGSGQATGKRTHKPVTFIKEWDPASSPQITVTEAGASVSGDLIATYDLKAAKK